MKRLHRNLIPSLISLLFVPTLLLAATKPSPTPTPTPALTPQVTQISKNDTERLTRLRDKGTNEIKRRLEILSDQTDRIGKMTSLRDTDRTVLLEQIKAEQTSLGILLTKITDTTATLTQMRAYMVSLTSEYQVFLVVGPKVALMIGVDHLAAAEKRFDDIVAELKTRVDEAKKSGKIKTDMETTFADLQNKIDSVHSKYTETHDKILPIQPNDFTAIKGALQTQRDTLKAAYEQLKAMLDDARALKSSLDTIK